MGEQPAWGDKIPCVYIGQHSLLLRSENGPFYDGDGKRRESLVLNVGDTLMMPPAEVLGVTYWIDPRGIFPAERIGLGRCVRAGDEKLSPEEAAAAGYEFHEGRRDFCTVEEAKKAADAAAAQKADAAASSKQSAAPPAKKAQQEVS